MKTPQWIKKLGGHAGELYVAAELSKRGIPNSLLPENFSDDDILIGKKDGELVGYIQVKACHPDRANSFILKNTDEAWVNADKNKFVVFVWLGSPIENESPEYWIARKSEVGRACMEHPQHKKSKWDRRFSRADLNPIWKNNWELLKDFFPI